MTVMDDLRLDDCVAVVTGGTRGIGLAITTALVELGADVVPTSRTESDVEDAAATVRERGGRSLVEAIDVTETDEVIALFDRTANELGGVDIVVNNAGINPSGALGQPEDVSDDAFEQVIAVNLKGAFRCARAGAEFLAESDGGSIVNVASVGGLVGLPRQHPYVASKHGLVGLTRSMALDWAPDVRVNAVAPGYVATDLTSELREQEHLRESILDRTPLERFGKPTEIGAPVAFLASDASSFVTGTTLTVDGGWTAR